jgi:hypothetical protein
VEILEDYILGETSSMNDRDEIVAQTVGWKILKDATICST